MSCLQLPLLFNAVFTRFGLRYEDQRFRVTGLGGI